MRFICSILILILLFILPASALEKLPDDIYFRNLEQGFSHEYLYALKDGRIWIKPNTGNTGVKGEWELFNKTGLPCGDDVPSFGDGDRIVQFSTEGTMIMALSDRGRFYIWQPTYFGETDWHEETGAPFSGPLYMPANRTWCFSFSTMTAPWKRQTPMHEKDIVSYWEDIDGNRTEFGFTATIYMVDPDGQRIRFTDTGLPTSWSKAIASPERGRFIIDKMSASASVIFVMNSTGKMYTRLYDFELDGGCPALRFVYNREKRTKGDEIAPLMTSIRTHPLPDWREQEPIREVIESRKGGGSAAITGNITILLTGKGNGSRELRVQGRDSRGRYGYWRKMLYAAAWEFMETGERFGDDEIIRDYPGRAPEGRTLDKNYSGKVSKCGEGELKAELLDFYYFNTPATLRIHVNGKYFDMKFHTVDLWSPTVQKKFYPELIGHPSGEPKLLQGAIEIPEELLNSADPDIRSTVDKYFREFNKEPIAFTVSADDRSVYIESKTLMRSLGKSLDYTTHGSLKFELVNREYIADQQEMSVFMEMAVRPELLLPADSSLMNEPESIERLLDLNEKALEEISDINKSMQRENLRSGCVSSCILPLYYLFNGCVTILGIPHWNMDDSTPGTRENITQLGGVSYTGGSPLKKHAWMNLREGFDDSADYETAVSIIKERIVKLRELRRGISRKKGD